MWIFQENHITSRHKLFFFGQRFLENSKPTHMSLLKSIITKTKSFITSLAMTCLICLIAASLPNWQLHLPSCICFIFWMYYLHSFAPEAESIILTLHTLCITLLVHHYCWQLFLSKKILKGRFFQEMSIVIKILKTTELIYWNKLSFFLSILFYFYSLLLLFPNNSHDNSWNKSCQFVRDFLRKSECPHKLWMFY